MIVLGRSAAFPITLAFADITVLRHRAACDQNDSLVGTRRRQATQRVP